MNGRLGRRRVPDYRRDRHHLVIWLLILDAAVLVVVVIMVDLLRVWLENYLNIWPLTTDRHLIASLLVSPVLLAMFRLQGLYDLDQILAGTREYARVGNAVTYGVFGAVIVSYFAGHEPLVSRLWLVLLWAFAILGVSLGRFAYRRVVRTLRRGGRFRTRLVIVGASTLGVAIAVQLTSAKGEGLDVVGFLDEYVPIGQRLLGEIAVVGRPDELVQSACGDLADEYILIPQALPAERLEQITRLMVARGGPVVRLAVSSSELLTNGLLIAERGNVPLVTLHRAQIDGADAALKRGLDLVGAVTALLVVGPATLFALLRSYMGRNRTLLESHSVFAAGGGKTSFRVLSWTVSSWLPIRGCPALFAVVRGTLSLVGPRPIAFQGGMAENPYGLTAVKPGLTGPWRVYGAHSSLANQALLDLSYVRNYTIWEDARILWHTVYRCLRSHRSLSVDRWQDAGLDGHLDALPVVTLN